MQTILTIGLDAFVTLLLGATIFFCAQLNKRIRILQDSKSELAELIRQFDESTHAATYSIQEIHKASKKLNENMQARLDKANYLADDLAFMIEKANKMADRMEGNINSPKAPPREAPRGRAAEEEVPEIPTRRAADAPRTRQEVEPRLERRAAPVEAVEPEAPQRRLGARVRSRSEQELFDAMKQR